MKKLVTTAPIAALTVLLAAGCSSAPKAETLAASPAATYVSQIPRPDAAQTVALRAELAKINPLLARELLG